ncbi:MAG: HEAT repeat domain-containing protein [Actinomycetota bacterium]
MNQLRVAWLLTAVSSALAGSVLVLEWLPARRSAPGEATSTATSVEEIAMLRRRLAISQSEAAALRTELDRMRAVLQLKQASDAQLAAGAEEGLSEQERRERLSVALKRVDGLIARLRDEPGPEVFAGLQEVLRAMLLAPMDDAAPFLAKYRDAVDPILKAFVLPQLAARYAESLTSFVSRELSDVDDPALRTQLIAELRVHSSPAEDAQARQILLSALTDEEDPRARQLAVEALGSLSTSETQQALLTVAMRDPDPVTREAAIRRLAENPEAREHLLSALSTDPDARMRRFGECAVELASPPIPR